jgi:plasmid stabilization system protein ParE
LRTEAKTYGARFDDAVRAALRWIGDRPRTWSADPNLPGARRFVLKRYPFVIVYVERDETVDVLAFAHTSREPGYWRDRR